MPRRPARFTQADIARAIKAIVQTGVRMVLEIDLNGTIRLVPVETSERAPESPKVRVEAGKEIVL